MRQALIVTGWLSKQHPLALATRFFRGQNRLMAATYTTARTVEFCHTDAAGIIHFSNFFLFMEQAEHEFLRHLGLSVVTDGPQGRISWPRVHASCDFQSAVRFEDEIQIEISVERVGQTSVTYSVRFTHEGHPVANGKLTVVCCQITMDSAPRSIPIPEEFARKLTA